MRLEVLAAVLTTVHPGIPTPKTPVRYVDIDVGRGVKLGVAVAGSGPVPVLLLHGFPVSLLAERPVLDQRSPNMLQSALALYSGVRRMCYSVEVSYASQSGLDFYSISQRTPCAHLV